MVKWWLKAGVALGIFAAAGLFSGCIGEQTSDKGSSRAKAEFLNVSYDPTRELYAEFDHVFGERWKQQTGQEVDFNHSNAGSSMQARSVIGGTKADVVTLALAYDVDEIARAGLIDKDWSKKFPDNSAPYTSTIVFLVRKGNPQNIRDWDDLIWPGVEIVTPNPKTSGAARWSYLAAWEYASWKSEGDEGRIKDFMRELYKNVVSLDDGARGATKTFIDLGKGDVLIDWENEALAAVNAYPDFEIVRPSVSILAEPSVAVVDAVVDKKGTREIAEEYIQYLYSLPGQEIAAKNFYRPRNMQVFAKYRSNFPELNLVTVDEAFGGWDKAYEKHFAGGGTFDQIYRR